MSDPDLPIPLGPCSNGEYDPFPPSPVTREARRRALEACADGASRLGVPGALRLSGADEGLKAKVLGLNAAKLYGIEPVPPRCDFTRRELGRSARSCATATGCWVPRRSWPPRTSASTTG